VGGDPPGVTFEMLYVSQHAAMVRLAYLMTGSQAAAEDLVHDAFLRVQSRVDGVERPEAYLRRSVVNACYSWHRSRRREGSNPADPPAAVGPSEHAEMWDALNRLSTSRRSVLVLRYYLDLPEAQVAQILGWRLGTVKSVTHRALRDLRRMLS
jgi:RNA polymerase sigma-70 factor (sigma-E family)